MLAIVTCRMLLNMRTYAGSSSDTSQPTMVMQVANNPTRNMSQGATFDIDDAQLEMEN